MEKKCFKCKKTKPIEQFYKHSQMKDGHLGKCKTCTKNDVNTRYQDPVAKKRIVAYEKARFKNPERKKKILEYSRKRKILFPGKARARYLASKLPKQPCEVCGNEKAQAHHPDYRKPIDVKWLCFKHHREEHGQKVSD